jgi:hypothetical protein
MTLAAPKERNNPANGRWHLALTFAILIFVFASASFFSPEKTFLAS